MGEDAYLERLNKYSAPDLWVKYASSYEIGPVWLVDDLSFPRSIRRHKEIFINIRGEYWKNYKQLFNAESYEESIVLKFLHEIGHIVRGHGGDPDLKICANGISKEFEEKVKQTPLDKLLDDTSEREAWEFALHIRTNQRDLFDNLLNTYKNWYQSYPNAVNWL